MSYASLGDCSNNPTAINNLSLVNVQLFMIRIICNLCGKFCLQIFMSQLWMRLERKENECMQAGKLGHNNIFSLITERIPYILQYILRLKIWLKYQFNVSKLKE